MSGRRCASILALSSILAATGCLIAPRYDARVIEAHKDAVLLIIYVPERLDPATYLRIAEDEIRRLVGSRQGGPLPLYEVQVEFLSPPDEKGNETKLASFSWKCGSDTVDWSDPAEHALVLY